MSRKCIVNGCDSVSQKGDPKHAFFYGMPVNEERMQLWVSIIERYSGLRPLRKNSQLKNAVVCGKHFGYESFRSHSVFENPKLLSNAVPSIFFCDFDAPRKNQINIKGTKNYLLMQRGKTIKGQVQKVFLFLSENIFKVFF